MVCIQASVIDVGKYCGEIYMPKRFTYIIFTDVWLSLTPPTWPPKVDYGEAFI